MPPRELGGGALRLVAALLVARGVGQLAEERLAALSPPFVELPALLVERAHPLAEARLLLGREPAERLTPLVHPVLAPQHAVLHLVAAEPTALVAEALAVLAEPAASLAALPARAVALFAEGLTASGRNGLGRGLRQRGTHEEQREGEAEKETSKHGR